MIVFRLNKSNTAKLSVSHCIPSAAIAAAVDNDGVDK